MANFMKAVEWMKEGKKVRRGEDKHLTIIKDGALYCTECKTNLLLSPNDVSHLRL